MLELGICGKISHIRFENNDIDLVKMILGLFSQILEFCDIGVNMLELGIRGNMRYHITQPIRDNKILHLLGQHANI